ncbi:MAG: PilZ domain-containing protein [Acidobacteriota bacterium]
MKKILVVEGHRPIEGLSGSLFRRRECVLGVASSYREALDVDAADRVDAFLVDSDLPGSTAEEFMEKLVEQGGTGAVLVVVDRDADERAAELLSAGAADIVRRPTCTTELTAKICQHLGVGLRQHERSLIELDATGTVGDTDFPVRIVDMSMGGVRFESTRRLTENEILRLKLALPGSNEDIIALGKIVRSESASGTWSHGLQFMDLPSWHVPAMEEFLTQVEAPVS